MEYRIYSTLPAFLGVPLTLGYIPTRLSLFPSLLLLYYYPVEFAHPHHVPRTPNPFLTTSRPIPSLLAERVHDEPFETVFLLFIVRVNVKNR
ncbi:hypothetical protein BDW02DRAFT_572097 [Decorospora gaudefroyi]|uniref:Uncharacterized protein n=1 Tax=Decorospora gaudefroyi TaxID=184978 RepID=A0A6A5K3I1_9PLEO|nr:hypothetical protein BDW02DRAFT_572097 [Decorospora gaudefroyi]